MKGILLLLATLLLVSYHAFSQTGHVGIGTIAPDSNAIVDMHSSTKGLLIPRMTISDRSTNIPAPSDGLMVYQTDGTAGIYIYNAATTTWRRLETNTEVQHYSVGGTGSIILTSASTGPTIVPGLTQTFTASTASTIALMATVGAANGGTAVGSQYSTVDIIAFLDNVGVVGSSSTGSVYNRFTVTNPGTAVNAFGSTTVISSFPVSAGPHTISIQAYRVSGTASQVNVGGLQSISPIPSSMLIDVRPN